MPTEYANTPRCSIVATREAGAHRQSGDLGGAPTDTGTASSGRSLDSLTLLGEAVEGPLSGGQRHRRSEVVA